jgi:competence ComEA-like helix-hairpin-helix protein
MNKVLIFLLVGFFSLNFVSGLCEEGQVDINNADAEELDELPGIGEVKSQAIIDARPFDSVEDLIDVYGIGEITLKNIKDPGLACVEGSENGNVDVDSNQEDEIPPEDEQGIIGGNENDGSEINEAGLENEGNTSKVDNILVLKNDNVINLNGDEENKELVYESKNEKIGNYAIYGFALFLIFVILVLLIKD